MPLESKKVSPINNLAFAYIKYSNSPSAEPCGTAALILVDIKNFCSLEITWSMSERQPNNLLGMCKKSKFSQESKIAYIALENAAIGA